MYMGSCKISYSLAKPDIFERDSGSHLHNPGFWFLPPLPEAQHLGCAIAEPIGRNIGIVVADGTGGCIVPGLKDALKSPEP